MQAGQAVAHFAFDLGLRRERGHRIDDHQIDRGRTHQRVDDFERLFTGVGLADEQFLQVDAELLRIGGVECVLGINESAGAPDLLHLGDHLQRQRGFAARLRAVDFDHAPARQAAHAERGVEPERAGGDDFDVFDHFAFAQTHDRALAELLFDLRQCSLQGFGFFCVQRFDGCVHEGLREVVRIIANAGCLYSNLMTIVEGHPAIQGDAPGTAL